MTISTDVNLFLNRLGEGVDEKRISNLFDSGTMSSGTLISLQWLKLLLSSHLFNTSGSGKTPFARWSLPQLGILFFMPTQGRP
jgi:hypothetical protein